MDLTTVLCLNILNKDLIRKIIHAFIPEFAEMDTIGGKNAMTILTSSKMSEIFL